jgi:DNA polymerase III alpha subunit
MKNMNLAQAIKNVKPDASCEIVNNDWETIIWRNDKIPSKEDVYAELNRLIQAEPLRQLREKRNQLLAQSDWMAVSDRTMTQAQIDYRQALRDLPATADPQLDENGNLTNVTWPTYE